MSIMTPLRTWLPLLSASSSSHPFAVWGKERQLAETPLPVRPVQRRPRRPDADASDLHRAMDDFVQVRAGVSLTEQIRIPYTAPADRRRDHLQFPGRQPFEE